jgi:general control protein GCN4
MDLFDEFTAFEGGASAQNASFHSAYSSALEPETPPNEPSLPHPTLIQLLDMSDQDPISFSHIAN